MPHTAARPSATATPSADTMTAAQPHDTIHSFLRHGLAVVVFNVIIAVFLTYVVHYGGDIATNMIYSQCIGLSIYTFINGLRLRFWPGRAPARLPMILIIITGIVAGYYVGTLVARAVLGTPVRATLMIEADPLGAVITTIVASLIGTAWLWTRQRMAIVDANAARVAAEAARVAAEAARVAADAAHVREDAARARADAESTERHLIESRLRLLQAQIEPHFLFNTLANLRSLISIDTPRALAMLDRFNDYLRATLTVTRAGQGTLKEEFTLLENYLGLLQIRMGARLGYELELPPALEATPLPPMLLQPLVENAVKHGLEPKIDGGLVRVAACLDNGVLCLSVSDTGLGLAGHAAATGQEGNGGSLGLRNVRERMLALYGPSASLSIAEQASGGVIAELRLPADTANTVHGDRA